MKAPIKLYKVSEDKNLMRLQSQLMVGKSSVDFIIEDGDLKHWTIANGGLGFHKTDIPYEIVESREQMKYQKL